MKKEMIINRLYEVHDAFKTTLSDLCADREQNQNEMNKLVHYRQRLRNKVCRAAPAEKEKLREEKQGVTADNGA